MCTIISKQPHADLDRPCYDTMVGHPMNNGHAEGPTREVGAKTARRAKAVVLYAAISGLALLVLIADTDIEQPRGCLQ